MKNSLVVTFLILLMGMPLAASGMRIAAPSIRAAGIPIIFDEIDGLVTTSKAIEQQHILDLCRSEKKEEKSCKVINNIFARQSEWPKMGYLKRLWNYNKMPMPADLTKAILYSQAAQLGTKIGWDKQRIEEERHRLIYEYDALNNKTQTK